MANLTPDEEAFFASGELPESMNEEAAAAAAVVTENVKEAEVLEPIAEPAVEAVDPNVAANERILAALDALSAKYEALSQQVTAKHEPAEEVPDELNDPLGAILHKLGTVDSKFAALETKLTTEQQNNLMRQQFEQFTASVNTAKAAFESTTPDFKDAYAHIRALRTDDLRAAGASEAEIPKILLQDELQLAQTAIQRGKNPAAEMYGMAKRYGYTGKVVPAPTPAPGVTLTPEQKMAAIKAGQGAARLPAKAGTTSDLTLDGLKDASNKDLNDIIMSDKMWQQIVGGKAGGDIF